jgi:prepilin-type N-terminal cleavage/methylation domain-containing protein
MKVESGGRVFRGWDEQKPHWSQRILGSGEGEALFSRSPDLLITRSSGHPIPGFHDQRGFTLFEVLLSITLIGFLMVALLIGLRVANRAWQTGEARLRLVHAAAERNAFVVEQISSLVPYRMISNDPQLPGTFTVLQASPNCLRFVSSYSSVYRSRTGQVLVEYGIVEASRGDFEVVVRETPVTDNEILYHKIVQSVTSDVETGLPVISYQPFSVKATDLRLMTGLSDAWFSYLDEHPKKSKVPVWREVWQSSDEAPYPDAVRLSWERGSQSGEEVMPLRAKLIPPSTPRQ